MKVFFTTNVRHFSWRLFIFLYLITWPNCIWKSVIKGSARFFCQYSCQNYVWSTFYAVLSRLFRTLETISNSSINATTAAHDPKNKIRNPPTNSGSFNMPSLPPCFCFPPREQGWLIVLDNLRRAKLISPAWCINKSLKIKSFLKISLNNFPKLNYWRSKCFVRGLFLGKLMHCLRFQNVFSANVTRHSPYFS